MPGVWKAATPTLSFNVGTMLLLTDGCVLAQDSGTRHWWKLTPDGRGSYLAGTWQRVSNSRNAPRYFASAVLKDGKVLIVGGRENNGQPANLLAAELYDPAADQWSDLPTPAGWTAIGDAPCCVLPDGKLLLGFITDNRCALFDTETRAWTATGTKVNNNSQGESWTLLPDGSVLAVNFDGHPDTQRYASGAWAAVGPANPNLAGAAPHEMGPAILLPGGSVLALGAGNATSIFSAGAWTPGPVFAMPGLSLAAKDAPACLLPNGRVLCTAGPVNGAPGDAYTGTTEFFEYDNALAAPALTRLTNPPPNANVAPPETRLLLLPDGTVLFSNGTPQVRIFEPDGAPDPAWAPHIAAWPTEITAGGTGRLEGSQFNGLSQACAYGDDASMATNYPIVRLRSTTPNGPVFYCRSFDHSSMAVATGGNACSTNFTVPQKVPAGPYMIAVIANGIASPERAIAISPYYLDDHRQLTEHERGLQHELFWRDINEVHLLMDYVSGRPDKSLGSLRDVPDPKTPSQCLHPDIVVEEVCKIRFPPEGSPTDRAQQAALLLNTKDRLNALADPARGMTIAYTSMFSGVALQVGTHHSKLVRKFLELIGHPAGSPEAACTRTRLQHSHAFAVEAYPNLKGHAERFRYWFSLLPWIVLTWAVLTALVYWDVAATAGALEKVTNLEQHETQLAQPGRAFVPSIVSCKSPGLENVGTCLRFNDIEAELVTSRRDLAGVTERHLLKHPIGWVMLWFGGEQTQLGDTQLGETKPREQLTAVVIGVFTNYLVPVMFGLLGALAGVVRMIWAKVRENTLRPEDARRAIASVPLGLVAGLAVGLIVSPSTTPVQGLTTVTGAVTLSATAIAFLAGYGVEAFFMMIDELLKRVFSINSDGK
jgi:hypothetical protein